MVVRSTDLTDGLTTATLNGKDITINLNPPRINGKSNILISDGLVDIDADNVVIHGIDTVLTPNSISSNIGDIAADNDAFSILVEALINAGLVDALSGDGPFAVFGNEIFLYLFVNMSTFRFQTYKHLPHFAACYVNRVVHLRPMTPS